MKKATLQEIHDLLVNWDECPERLIEEINVELNRGAEKKAANAAAYDAIHDIVMDALSDTPATIAEIYEAIESNLPDGITKAKVQYAITRLWKDEIVKVDGSPCGYRKA